MLGCCRESGPVCTPPMPMPLLNGRSYRPVHRQEPLLSLPSTGTRPVNMPVRCRPGSKPVFAAEGTYAFAEAARHYQRALELWERVPDSSRPVGLDRVDLLASVGEAVAFTGGIEHAIACLKDAVGRADPIAESHRAARLLVRLGEYRREVGDEAGALATFTEAEQLLAEAPPSPTQARVLAAHAFALLLGRRTEEAKTRCQEALTVARAVGARAEEAWALRVLASCLSHLGELDRAISMALEARRVAEEAGDAEALVTTYVALVAFLGYAGQDHDAIEQGWQGYRLARDLGLERAEGSRVADNLAFSLLNVGRWTECERLTRELTASDSWGAFGLHQSLGVLLARRGEFEAAREQLDLALELGPPYFEGLTWLGPAELALWEAARRRRPQRLPRDSAGSPNGTQMGTFPTAPSFGTRWFCDWRPIGPNGQRIGERPTRSAKLDNGPLQSCMRSTDSLLPRRHRRTIRSLPATFCSPVLRSPDYRNDPTQSAGRPPPPHGSD